ncbi:hypothetical protein BDZ89DRAFT_1138906 [Hymenopellis radicata]|nr:hypothetical protein BDZ89DRAFT_1138906 [Hymenopellis radicata]
MTTLTATICVWATAAATFVGHYPWFATYSYLSEMLPLPDPVQPHAFLLKLLRAAFIGFVASVIWDTISNSLRVVKTLTRCTKVSYTAAAQAVIRADGISGLFGRGLKTRIVANGLQGLMNDQQARLTAHHRRPTTSHKHDHGKVRKVPLAWSVAKLLEKHLPVDEPFMPEGALELTADCASLFYPNLVPKTLGTQERLNLIHSKKLLSLPRMASCGYDVAKDRESSRTLDDIAKSICKEVSVPFAGVKRALPEALITASEMDGEHTELLSLTFDKEDEKEVVAGAVAVVAYTEWMNQVSWALEVGEHVSYSEADGDDEFPQVHPLLRHLTEY